MRIKYFSVIITLIIFGSIPLFAQISITQAESIAETIYTDLSTELKNIGIGEPDIYITDSTEINGSVNFRDAFKDMNGLLINYKISLNVNFKKTTPLMFAVLVSHEFSHILGVSTNEGSNSFNTKKTNNINDQLVSEAEADYLSLKILLKIVMNNSKFLEGLKDERHSEILRQLKVNNPNLKIEKLTVIASLILATQDNLNLNNKNKVNMDTPDNSVRKPPEKDEYLNPQSRLDTAIAGVLNKDRPWCWWNSEKS